MFRKQLNNSHFVSGSDPGSLSTIFWSFIFPQFLYGSSLWIFGLREVFRYQGSLIFGYGKHWNALRCLYRRCARAVLGGRPNTSGEAVLVLLGWLPWIICLLFMVLNGTLSFGLVYVVLKCVVELYL